MGKEAFVLTSLTRSFQVFNSKLKLKASSPTHSRRIVALAASGETTFTACGSRILVWNRARLVRELAGHSSAVHLLLVMGGVLLSVDRENELCLWDIATLEPLRQAPLKLGATRVSCVLHPATYLNKALFGSDAGQLFLWNFNTGKLLFTFAGWGSPVTCLEQSPALDVVAVGLADGRVVLHNIRTDSTVVTLRHTGAAVTCLSFRNDAEAQSGNSSAAQPPPTLVSGDSAGMLAVWDLAKRKMVALIKSAHRGGGGGVASVSFFAGEPVMVSAGTSDNSLKMWIFDSEDGSARLLRERSGHSAPPRVLLFVEQETILSGGGDGAVRRISVIQDQRSVELSQKPLKKVTQGKVARFPPVVALGYNDSRRHEWSALVSVHAGMPSLWPWETDKLQGRSLIPPGDGSSIRCCTITRCGNFAIMGTAAGGLFRANLQSLKFRGAIAKAHAGAVEGVATDIHERVCVTCGLDGFVRFWDLGELTVASEIDIGSALGAMAVHREGGLVTVSADDWCIRVIDIESRSIVREFRGHTNQVTALCFSGDCKWLVSASADSTVRTWDIISSQCIDGFLCPKPAVAVAFSPKNDMLATAHLDDVGVFLWSNRAHFANVYLRPFESAAMAKMSLPSVRADDNDFFVFEEPAEAAPFGAEGGGAATAAAWSFLRELPVANAGKLLQQSGDSETKFLSVIHVEDVKRRNKPIQPPSQGERAPFTLTTVPGAKTVQFVKSTEVDPFAGGLGSRVLESGGGLASEGPLSGVLREGAAGGNWEALAVRLRGSNPSAVDADVRLLSLEKDNRELRLFVDFLLWMLEARREFDLVQGYMSCFLSAHGDTLAAQPLLKEALARLAAVQQSVWRDVNELFQRNECLCSLMTRIEPF